MKESEIVGSAITATFRTREAMLLMSNVDFLLTFGVIDEERHRRIIDSVLTCMLCINVHAQHLEEEHMNWLFDSIKMMSEGIKMVGRKAGLDSPEKGYKATVGDIATVVIAGMADVAELMHEYEPDKGWDKVCREYKDKLQEVRNERS